MKNIIAALVNFQVDADNLLADSTNPSRGNKFSSLPMMLVELRPLLKKHGLAIVTMPAGFGDAGVIDGTTGSGKQYREMAGVFSTITTLYHISGEVLDLGHTSVPLNIGNPGVANLEKVAAAFTTIRRLVLFGVAGIAQVDTPEKTQAHQSVDDGLIEQAGQVAETIDELDALRSAARQFMASLQNQQRKGELTAIFSKRAEALK